MKREEREIEEIEIVEKKEMYNRLNILGDKYICRRVMKYEK